MVLSRSGFLTTLTVFCTVMCMTAMPAYAQAEPETGAAEVTDQAAPGTDTEDPGQEAQNTAGASEYFSKGGAEDPLQAARSNLVAESVETVRKDGAQAQLERSNMESVKTVVGNSHMTTEQQKPKMVVAATNGYLNVHMGPEIGSEIVGKLYSNDVATVLQDDGSGWVRIRSGNVTGYVMGDYLLSDRESKMLTDIIAKDVATVGTDEAAVYYGKDKTSGVLRPADSGEQFTVQGEEDGWVKVSTESGEGYIPADDTDVAKVLPTAESSEEEAERLEASNVQDLLDHEKEKAEEADRIARAAQEQAEKAEKAGEEKPEELEAAQSAAEAAQSAADNAQVQVEAAQVAVDESGAEMGQAVVDYAMQFLGNPYVWGGSSLTHGTDCSGFTMSVYAHFGVGLAHFDAAQRSAGIGISSLAEARPGDLICYYGHVGIYIGDGKIVHAANEQLGITIGAADHQTIAAIRRIFY